MNELTTLAEQFEIAQKSLVGGYVAIIIISGITACIVFTVLSVVSWAHLREIYGELLMRICEVLTYLAFFAATYACVFSIIVVLTNEPVSYSEFYIEYNKATEERQAEPHVIDKVTEYNKWYQSQLEQGILGKLSESESRRLDKLTPID